MSITPPGALCPEQLAVAPVVILAENRLENTSKSQSATGAAMFFTFPEDAHWNAERQAVEFGVGRCGGIEKTSLISLTSEERRARPHMA